MRDHNATSAHQAMDDYAARTMHGRTYKMPAKGYGVLHLRRTRGVRFDILVIATMLAGAILATLYTLA